MGQQDPRGELEHVQGVETYELLSTKLTPPRLHQLFVPRKSLLDRLEAGTQRKLTLISAPAGFGKTTLLSEWVENLKLKAGSARQPKLTRQSSNLQLPLSVAWVSLDPGDNDPVRFWRYVLTASKAFDEGIGNSALAVLNTSPQPPFQALLTGFINGMAQLPSKAVLVLEDYHLITAAQVHETVTYFLDYLPSTLHVIMMTRSDPPLPLARLRARNELDELRAEDLRFSLDETRAFLDQVLPFTLPSEMVSRLASRTEGWAAGLRLVSLASRRRGERGDIDQFLETFTGSHRPIMDYLIGDVFDAQPEPVQQFLLQTSVLSRLTGSLCDAITGRDDSALILEQLERDNLFLVSLDASQQWYRFHGLFAEAMQHVAQGRIGESRLRQLSHKASIWYEEHGMLSEAVEVALSTQAFTRAAGLIDGLIPRRLVNYEFHTLRRWMEPLPADVLRPYPNLCFTLAMAVFFTSDRYAPETSALLTPWLRMAEQAWQAEANRNKLGELFAFRSLVAWFQRDLGQTFAEARRALELLPEENAQWRGISLIYVGLKELLDGRLNAARLMLLQALELCRSAGNSYGALDTTRLLGQVYAAQGELHQASQFYQQVLAETEKTPLDSQLAQIRKGRALAGLSTLELEWNDLEAAARDASRALDIEGSYADEQLRIQGSLAMARIQHARGESAWAQQRLQALIAQTKSALPLSELEACLARLSLTAGDLAAVQHWVAARPQPVDLPRIQAEQEALVVARLLIEQGEAGAAIHQLEGWLTEAQDNGRTRSELEIEILLALAHAALGDRAQAGRTLVRALALAQPEGYQRIFIDAGERLATLLRDTLPEIQDESLLAYARALLYTISSQEQVGKVVDAPGSSGLLIEPLSEQELRVLRLLAAGLSNPQVAEELFISVNTVKTHVKNIYAKLGVNSREQARQAARHLKLL